MTTLFKNALISVPNPEANGGETVRFAFDITADENGVDVIDTRIFLNSYGNSSSMTLGCITPEFLHAMADNLENVVRLIKENKPNTPYHRHYQKET